MSKQVFNQLLIDSQNDPNIVGFILTGSRGKEFVTEHSDYDAILVVEDDALDQYKHKYDDLKPYDIELRILSLSELKKFAEWNSEHAWDRYNFTHLKAQVDKKDGLIQTLINEKGVFPAEQIHNYVSGSLDAYINSVYRSLKDYRDGLTLASKLDAAESLNFLLNLIFAFNGRIRPYNKYLEWELNKYPLEKLPWSNSEFLKLTSEVISREWIKSQQDLLIGIEELLRPAGYGNVFDGWGEKLSWIKAVSFDKQS